MNSLSCHSPQSSLAGALKKYSNLTRRSASPNYLHMHAPGPPLVKTSRGAKTRWSVVVTDQHARRGKWVGRVGNLADWAISFDESKLALRILHNRWHECIQPLLYDFNQSQTCINLYEFAHNIFIGIYHRYIVGGMCVYCVLRLTL